MARRSDHGAGSTHEAGPTKGPAVESVAFGEGLELDHARRVAAAGYPGMRGDGDTMPFGKGSGEVDWPTGGNTWADRAGPG